MCYPGKGLASCPRERLLLTPAPRKPAALTGAALGVPAPCPGHGHHVAACAVRPETLGLSPPDVSACCSEAAFAANSAASCRSEVTF